MQGDWRSNMQNIISQRHRHKSWKRIVSGLMAAVVFCTTYALILPAITKEKKTYCGTEEHIHTEACYEMQAASQKILTCALEENEEDFIPHQHDDTCYTETQELVCEMEEAEEHAHTEDCYTAVRTLTCQEEETWAHQHTEECYAESASAEEEVLTCGMEEHTHADQCFTEPEIITFTYEDGDISGVITLPWSRTLPEDLSCTVVKLDDTEDNYNEMYASVNEALSSDSQMISEIQFYELEWQSEGESYILPEGLVPTVELTLNQSADSEETFTGVVLTEGNQDNQEGTAKEEEEPSEELDVPEAEQRTDKIEEPEAVIDRASEKQPEDGTEAAEESQSAELISAPLNLVQSALQSTDETEENDDTAGKTYSADTVPVEDGSVSLKLKSTKIFALAATATRTAGYYYKRVDSLQEIRDHYNSGYTEKYVIVYANSVQLAFGTDTWYTAPIEVRPVKGYENEGYVQLVYVYGNGVSVNGSSVYGYRNNQWVNPTDDKDRHWQIKPHPKDSNAFYIWENEDVNDELWTSSYDSNWIYLDHYDDTNTWRIHGYTNYMAYSEDEKKAKNLTDTAYLAQCNMLIFRYVGGELDIPDDVAGKGNISNGQPEAWSNYEYDDYLQVSDSESGTITAEETLVDSAAMTYASDPSTADIETELGSRTKTETGEALYAVQKENDGRLLTDKSVVYGKDDYDAASVEGYGDYEAGDFSTTLSALGQEWMVTDVVNTTAPVDVVYVLDISSSMTDGTGGGSWVAAMNSINLSMKNVLARNEANRVGLVAFSNKAQEILPLDRYTADDDKYLTSTSEVYSVTYPSFKNIYGTTKAAQTVNLAVNITTVGSLNYEGGTKEGSIRSAGQVAQKKMNFLGAWEKTNTQEGLQLAYEVFLEMKAMSDDYLTFEAGGEELPRQPVIILVTDGDPTICTYNYMYPKAGPTYGQGKSVGVEGYYTILTANYFKNLTSILYQRLAGFYTIGINCYTNYQLAVLDPTEARVKACQGGDAETANQLYQLLEDIGPGTGTTGGTFTQNVKPQEAGTDAQGQQLYYLEYSRGVLGLGINTPVIRGVYNPYLSDYNYCDKAWFGSLTEEGMNAIFENILNRVQLINNYNFLLKENTSLVMTDYIGDSMTVKGVPVLRYFGKNYAPDADTVEGTDSSGSYVIYKWTQTAERLPSDSKEKEGTAVSLSGISARVTTAADGSQTVTFTVPEDALPTYYPDLYKTFYYEELPVRLIYRVGLTDEEIESLNSVSGAITEQTYYTSLFNQESGEAYTTAIFTPAESNPYYTSGLDKTTDKLDNITETSSYSFSETVNADGKTVTQLLGNNGRLTVSRSDMLNLTVKKEWAAGTAPAKSVRVLLYATGTRQKTGEDESQEGTWMIGSATLNADNGWKYTWKNLSKDGSGPYYSYEYSSFYIAEAAMDAYDVTYQDEKGNKLGTEKLLVDISDVTLKPGETAEVKAASANSGTIVIVNADPYVLPHAGGIGTNWFTLSGTTIVIAACFVYIFIRYRKRQTRKGGEV